MVMQTIHSQFDSASSYLEGNTDPVFSSIAADIFKAVSYTHLTLPTNREV